MTPSAEGSKPIRLSARSPLGRALPQVVLEFKERLEFLLQLAELRAGDAEPVQASPLPRQPLRQPPACSQLKRLPQQLGMVGQQPVERLGVAPRGRTPS
jgi:hypothetical protein